MAPRMRDGIRGEHVKDDLSDLVARAQTGDEAAFAALVAATQGLVYNLALSILRDHQEAEDVTQDVYLRVWNALPDFRGEAKFTTWLYRIGTNLSLNRRRHLRTRLRIVDAEDALDELASHQEGPAAKADRADERAWLWGMVDRLPSKYRLVITMFYQQELSYKEVAETLALPLGTVKAHLNRARSALAKALTARETVMSMEPEVADVAV